MAIHLTPTELGRELGMHRRDVIARCVELGVPIFRGEIDKALFLASLARHRSTAKPGRAPAREGEGRPA